MIPGEVEGITRSDELNVVERFRGLEIAVIEFYSISSVEINLLSHYRPQHKISEHVTHSVDFAIEGGATLPLGLDNIPNVEAYNKQYTRKSTTNIQCFKRGQLIGHI